MPLAWTVVGAPLLVNVAVPFGTTGLDDQLAPSTHSLGSPALPPIQVPSTAWAEMVPSAVLASRTVVASNEERTRRGAFRTGGSGNRKALSPELSAAESTP